MDSAGARPLPHPAVLAAEAHLRLLALRARVHRARLDRARRRVGYLEVVWAQAARDLRDAGDEWAAREPRPPVRLMPAHWPGVDVLRPAASR